MSTKKGKKTESGRASGKNPTVEMVRQLARIVDTHGLSELVIEAEEANITMRRGPGQPSTVIHTGPQAMMAAHAPAPAPAGEPAAGVKPAEAPKEADDNLHVVTSPFVGTFYRAPNPDAAPYVQVGDRVDRGAVLCIVEAMKLMNEIEADAAGEIAAVLVENGDAVEYGQPLFKIAPA
jgi:acetyl-CoA carboxylase biotin carboxyl carrier protein